MSNNKGVFERFWGVIIWLKYGEGKVFFFSFINWVVFGFVNLFNLDLMLDLWDWILLLLFGNFLFELLVLYDELCVVFFCLEFKFFCLSKGDDKWCCCMVFVVGDILVLFEDCCIWNWVCFLGEVVLFCVCFGCLLFLFELIFFVLVFCFLLLNCFVGIFGFMLFFFGKFCFLLIFFEIFFFDEWLFLIFLGKEFKLVFLNVFFFYF